MNWPLFISTFMLIFIAELPDKTAFATVLLATRGRASAVFVGAALAFLVQTIVAAFFGRIISLAPEKWVHLGVGLIFLAFAFHGYLRKEDEETKPSSDAVCVVRFWPCAWKAFVVIFIGEWGDLTQIATASLLAKNREFQFTVFSAALLALWSVTLLAVLLGAKASEYVKPHLIRQLSIYIFTVIGLYFILTWACG